MKQGIAFPRTHAVAALIGSGARLGGFQAPQGARMFCSV